MNVREIITLRALQDSPRSNIQIQSTSQIDYKKGNLLLYNLKNPRKVKGREDQIKKEKIEPVKKNACE